MSRRVLAPLRALAALRARLATASPRIALRSRPSLGRARRRRTRAKACGGSSAWRSSWTNGAEAATESFPTGALRIRCAVRRGARRRSGRRRRTAAIRACRSSACSRRACSTSIARCSPASTKRSGRRRSRPTPFSTGRCAPRSASRRRSGASARPRMISSPRSGAREAILSRAKKRGGEPTVASRFLQRIAAAAGAAPQAIARREARGERYLAFARALDRPAEFRPRQAPGAAAAGRAAAAVAQRHPHRDPAARPLRDLRRAHPPA